MHTLVTGRNVKITPGVRTLIARQLGKLARVLNDSAVSAQVILRRERHRHVAELTIHARGDHRLFGSGHGDDWAMSVRAAAAKVEKQAQRLKTRWRERKRRAAGRRHPSQRRSRGNGGPIAEPVVRTPPAAVKPMSVEDAVIGLRERGDQFLVFRNAATEAVNILYRRKDGRLGLIEPEA